MAFWNYVLPVEFTNIIDDTRLVNEVFDRLNRNSRRLTEQELRHAKYDGWFIRFVEREADSRDWEKLRVVTTARAKRMGDVQFLSELFIILLKGDVGGFDQNEIWEYCAKYDDLSDLDIPFDEEPVKRRFQDAKAYLLELEGKGEVVSKHARDLTNLYSLWAVVALCYESLPDIGGFAKNYGEFMNRVKKYRDKAYFTKVLNGEEKPSETMSLTYYQNSIGASTEPPQRQERNKVLRQVLLEACSA